MNYTIVQKMCRTADDRENFIEQCNQVITEGFTPLGGVSIVPASENNRLTYLYQAFYRPSTSTGGDIDSSKGN